MTGQNPSMVASFLSDMPIEAIPVLSVVVPDEAVSQSLRDALNARLQEKQDFMALEAQILQTLLPEMARLTTELVQTSLREVWLQRSGAVD